MDWSFIKHCRFLNLNCYCDISSRLMRIIKCILYFWFQVCVCALIRLPFFNGADGYLCQWTGSASIIVTLVRGLSAVDPDVC